VGVDPDTGAERRPKPRDGARSGQEVAGGILCVDAQLDRVAAQLGPARPRQPLACRNAKLSLREVDAGEHVQWPDRKTGRAPGFGDLAPRVGLSKRRPRRE
jgi:hypothetical protein